MASVTPTKHSTHRQTVHSPADNDQPIIPTANTAPRVTKIQGFDSYRRWGVQLRMPGFYSYGRKPRHFVYTGAMRFDTLLERAGLHGGWAREAALAGLALGVGFGLMPLLIFLAGSLTLGKYENAGAARLYASIYQGLAAGSVASWVIVLGPYGLMLLFRGLRLWWRAGERPAAT